MRLLYRASLDDMMGNHRQEAVLQIAREKVLLLTNLTAKSSENEKFLHFSAKTGFLG